MGKVWKKLLFIILIIACLFNIVSKLVKRNSLQDELQATYDYFFNRKETVEQNETENK